MEKAPITGSIGITPKGIEWQIIRLKQEGLLKRIGPPKGAVAARLRARRRARLLTCPVTRPMRYPVNAYEKGMRVLEGRCPRCGGAVARVIEND